MSEEGFGQQGERVGGGRYRLLGELGRGGMGVVWRAYDEALGREVAIKEVRAPAGLGDRDIDRLYARMEREGRAAARVSHRNVVTVYDVAMEGRPWIVMELVRGLSLADVLDAEGPLPPARAARIGAEVLAALRAAHAVGVLHRDVKPGNVLMANDGRVVLTDFGIAVVEGDAALTLTGELVGSPEFLAPERALGRSPGPEADLWSLGVLLYAAVEGFSPFRQDTPLSTLRAVVDESLPRPRRAGPLTSVLEGLLDKDPRRRLPATEAERLLRLVAAGGTPAGGSSSSSNAFGPAATAETEPLGRLPEPGATPAYPPAPDGPAGPADEPPPPRRQRAAVAALVAGALLAVLSLGGLTWALLNDDGSDHEGNGGGGSAATGTASPAHGGSGDDRGEDAESKDAESKDAKGKDGGRTTSGAPSGSTTRPPALTITVVVKPVRADYQGTCPPPEDSAPSFTATLTVNRVPATVEYRWITGSGKVSDPGWKTLAFGGDKSRTVRHTELSYAADGSHEDWIAVETRSPGSGTSGHVSFATTCEEAPADGTSSPASGGARGSGG
ncbi:serine/threonine-protein kinase [Streptomyces sp. MK37H]|uniref:serine/threonine-protein kinase n=1 Tax=Streptomyces sp. MK37H TaxID=2699117 RepID=UPI001B377ABD|nr:serine/threonine-protein kinase [Streptomyces sp. MK37H]MBP8537695.1 protein kinase [Streptomyces sp. MK37H]